MTTYLRLLGYLRPYRGRLVVAILSMIGLAAATGLYPLALELLTTYLVEGTTGTRRVLEPALARVTEVSSALGLGAGAERLAAIIEANLLASFGVIVAVKVGCQAVRFYEMGLIAQLVIRDLRRDLFQAVIRQSARFFGDQATGLLISRVVNDVAQVERAATYAVPVLVGDVLRVLVLSAVALSRYPELSLVALGVGPFAVLPIVHFGKLLKRHAKRSQEELALLSNRVAETAGGIRVVHAYGGEGEEAARFGRAGDAYLATMTKSVLVRALQTPVMELIGVCALFAAVALASARLESGALRPGEVVGFVLALVLLYEPVKALGRIGGMVLPGIAAAERVFEVADRPPEITDRPGARALLGPPSVVRLEGVTLRYRDTGPPALDHVDLELASGRIVALVGPSGGGKSSIASLLVRHFDPSEGRVTVDGIDVRDVTLRSLRAQIALVAQETYLFNDSVHANIAYGRPDASRAQVEAAARRAHAHELILALPRGYDTVTGERGVQLSGGQRQRIAIARAFLKDAPILVLDEATSALDAESEREVQSAIDALMVDRTVLVIAHRLSTIRRAHEIVVLDQGRIAERGTHAELLARGTAYARLIAASEGGGRS